MVRANPFLFSSSSQRPPTHSTHSPISQLPAPPVRAPAAARRSRRSVTSPASVGFVQLFRRRALHPFTSSRRQARPRAASRTRTPPAAPSASRRRCLNLTVRAAVSAGRLDSHAFGFGILGNNRCGFWLDLGAIVDNAGGLELVHKEFLQMYAYVYLKPTPVVPCYTT